MIENQALKGKVDLLQMKLEMSVQRTTFASQPAVFGPSASSSATITTGFGPMETGFGPMDPSL